MADSAVPDFFDRFPMRAVASGGLDAALAEEGAPPLSVLFLWGRACPNCDVAKRAMLAAAPRFALPGVRWLHANVYDDMDVATRFGLHGIPAFLVFRGRRLAGRVTGWPGADELLGALARQGRAGPAG